MNKKLKNTIDGIDSINSKLYDDLYVNQLEKRLETDPLLVNGLLDLLSTNGMDPGNIDLLCDGCHAESTYTVVVCKGGTYPD